MTENTQSTPRPRDGRPVLASEIHAVAFCPESYRLKRSGARPAAHASRDAARGRGCQSARHGRDARGALVLCGDLYGMDDPRTESLRVWRDDHLRGHAPGRAFIAVYYRLSPLLVSVARRWPWLDRPIAAVVDRVVARVRVRQGGAMSMMVVDWLAAGVAFAVLFWLARVLWRWLRGTQRLSVIGGDKLLYQDDANNRRTLVHPQFNVAA